MTMRAEVVFSKEDELIIITYRGKTTSKDLRIAAERASGFIVSYACPRILVDVRDSAPAVPVADIYDMPDVYASLAAPGNLMIAMVATRTATGYKDYHFYETVCRNKGVRVEIFEDMASAKAWLKGQHQKDTGADPS